MMKKRKKHLLERKILGITLQNYLLMLGLLVIISLGTSISKGIIGGFRMVFGAVFVLLTPGFLISHLLLGEKEIDGLERLALSFALSITVIPLIVFYLNMIGMKISTVSVSLTILAICILTAIAILLKNRIRK